LGLDVPDRVADRVTFVRSNPSVVQDFSDAAGAWDDVLMVVQSLFFGGVSSGLGAQHGGWGKAAIKALRGDFEVGLVLGYALDVLGGDDEMKRDEFCGGAFESIFVVRDGTHDR
jgi:hypothetical protein